MNLDDVNRKGQKLKKRLRVGRGTGSGSGKTAGRGGKGQTARNGYNLRPLFEGGQMPISRRVPKHGFNNARFRVEYEVVNVDQLEKLFEDGATVDPEAIRKTGLLASKGVLIKILARGEIKKKLHVKAHKFSEQARQKIEAAGGTTAGV